MRSDALIVADDGKEGISFYTIPMFALTKEVVEALLNMDSPNFPERWELGPLWAFRDHVKEITDPRGEWPDVLVTEMWDWHSRNGPRPKKPE